MKVVFPAPVGPTMAMRLPFGAFMLKSFKITWSFWYPKLTWESSTSPWAFSSGARFPVCRLRGLVDDLKDPLCRRQGGLELTVDLCDLPDGPGELSGVEHEGRDAADADGAMEIQDGSEYGDQGQGQVVDGIVAGPMMLA